MVLNPIEIFHFVRIGELPTSAQGWVFTNGLFGVQEINGSFYGQISSPLFLTYNLGIVGFIGLAIMTDWNTLSWYYLGTSLKVSIGTEYQEP